MAETLGVLLAGGRGSRLAHGVPKALVRVGGLTLFERANEPKQFLQIRGDHNEGVFVSRQEYERGLERFVAAYFPPPSSS